MDAAPASGDAAALEGGPSSGKDFLAGSRKWPEGSTISNPMGSGEAQAFGQFAYSKAF